MSTTIFDVPITEDVLEDNRFTSAWEDWLDILSEIQTKIEVIKAIMDPSSVAANTTAEQVITITQVVDDRGDIKTIAESDAVLEVGDHIIKIIKPTLAAGLIINQGRVTDTNEITIEFGNVTASAIDVPSETYTLIILKG